MAAIEISGLRKRYSGSEAPAVDDLDLIVERGEFFGLLGPNGAGKSTTVSILCGLLRADRGSARVLGLDASREARRIQSLLGLVPQDVALYAALSARENLLFFGRIYGLRGAMLRSRVDDCLALVGLEASADRLVGTYSGGMRRRANLAAGLLHEPTLLVLDEPTVGIDAQSRHAIFERLTDLNRSQGVTLLYATHYMEEAAQLCSRIAVLDQGRVMAQGRPRELVEARPGCANLEQLFLDLTGRHLRD
ncbi:MAG: ABC transporter ATP-binding protein [Deltaproteobacteria bacterium]|nr:ABC transporter ATP-binding protein [Deltaproteobacteria bacterium]